MYHCQMGTLRIHRPQHRPLIIAQHLSRLDAVHELDDLRLLADQGSTLPKSLFPGTSVLPGDKAVSGCPNTSDEHAIGIWRLGPSCDLGTRSWPS